MQISVSRLAYSVKAPAPNPCCPDRSSRAEIAPASYWHPGDGIRAGRRAVDGSALRRPDSRRSCGWHVRRKLG